MSALRPFTMEKELRNVPPVGMNPGKIEKRDITWIGKTCDETYSNERF